MSSRRGLAACARCSRSTRAARGSGGRCTAVAWVSWAWAAGRSSCSPHCSTPTRPTTWRRAPTTRTSRRAACRPARWRRAPRRPASAGRGRRAPGAWAARREELTHAFGLRAERARDPLEGKGSAPLAQQRAQVGQRPQVPQLVRVDDRVHALDLALRDVEGDHGDQPALAVEEQRTRLPVYFLAARGDAEAGEGAQPGGQRARRPGAAVDRSCEGGCLAAAVGAEDHVVGQQLLQPLEIALLGGREEAGRELLQLLARGLEPGALLLHVAACPCGQLAGVLLARADD